MNSDTNRSVGVTELLNDGMDDALPAVYDRLKRLAAHHMRSERVGHTLSATALVHEAYVKLSAQDRAQWKNRAQFFSVASTAMRRILVSHARDRLAQKRGGAFDHTTMNGASEIPSGDSIQRQTELLTVDHLLHDLAEHDGRAARVVECRYFGGYTNEETAEALGVSVMTVKRSWLLAKAWLARAMAESAGQSPSDSHNNAGDP